MLSLLRLLLLLATAPSLAFAQPAGASDLKRWAKVIRDAGIKVE